MTEENSITLTSPIAEAGKYSQQIKATFDANFFALVSEHLYPSPNKAFEELVTNSWDADASSVYVRIPSNLHTEEAAICILDNGKSMDIQGLAQLWSIGNSSKRSESTTERKRIGKFGIGKLATYLLCNELTYICKASDGIVRIVTMDYRKIQKDYDKEASSLVLSVREITLPELKDVLERYEGGTSSFELIMRGVPAINSTDQYYNEYGGNEVCPKKAHNTWTLAILTSLKGQGMEIEIGRTKWMLSKALPLGASMKIEFNGTEIIPSKDDAPIREQWTVGPDLPFDSFELEKNDTIDFRKDNVPYPRIIIPGVGEVTGTVTLYKNSIASGKSNDMEVSNGCFVNVLGRVINSDGTGQFSVGSSGQGTYAKFRAAIRVDDLDNAMTIQRDTLTELKSVKLVRAFLLRMFNYARQIEEGAAAALLASASKARKGSFNAIPFSNFGSQLRMSLNDMAKLPAFINSSQNVDIDSIEVWLSETTDGLNGAIEGFDMVEEDPNQELARYNLSRRKIEINKNHPFALEHALTTEQRAVLEDIVLVNILSDCYLYERGVDNGILRDMITYRDISQRTVAQLRRNSPVQIIRLLDAWNDEAKPLEEIVGDALLHLGFKVDRLGQKGKPEGVAEAYITPAEEGHSRIYRVTYDAKSSVKKKVQTGNVHTAGLARHRNDYQANYSLVVAPDFQKGALSAEAEGNNITPMTTKALGRLVTFTISYGPFSLVQLEEVFKLRDPNAVDNWITDIEQTLKSQRQFTIGTVVEAMKAAREHGVLDVLSASVIAQNYRTITGDLGWPNTGDVSKMVQSLSKLAPKIISTDPKDESRVFLTASPDQLMIEIRRQIEQLPQSARIGVLYGA